MPEDKEQVPVSDENIAPDGSLIIDTPLKTKEVLEAITSMNKRKRLTVWYLMRRW